MVVQLFRHSAGSLWDSSSVRACSSPRKAQPRAAQGAASRRPPGRTGARDTAPIAEAISWIHREPRDLVQFEYDMTVRVRLLVFWVSKDDVGGGYIRRAVSKGDGRLE